jgi:hypothetical protein
MADDNDQELATSGTLTQSRIVINTFAKRAYDDMIVSYNQGNTISTLSGAIPRTKEDQAIHEGEWVFSMIGDRVTPGQQMEVFSNLNCVALQTPMNQPVEKVQEIRKRVRLVGLADNTIKYADHRPVGNGQLAVVIGGSRPFRNTGPETIKAGQYISVKVPEFDQNESQIGRAIGVTTGVSPELIREQAKLRNHSDVLSTQVFTELIESIIYPIVVGIRHATPADPAQPNQVPLSALNLAGGVVPADIAARFAATPIQNWAPSKADDPDALVSNEVATCMLIAKALARGFRDTLREPTRAEFVGTMMSPMCVVGANTMLEETSFIGGLALEDVNPGKNGDAVVIHGPAPIGERMV